MKRMHSRMWLVICGLLMVTGCDKLQSLVNKQSKPTPLSSLDASAEVKNLIQSHAAKGARLDRNVMLHFSLVNCGPCARLDEDILASREWRDFARENLIESLFEFPTEFTSEDTELVSNIQAMEALAKHLGVDSAFPLLVILGRDGSILGGRSGLSPGGVAGYVGWASGLVKSDTSPHVAGGATAPEAKTTPEVTATKQPKSTAATAPSSPANTPAVSAAQPAASPPVPANPLDHLRVTGIAGSASSRMAMIQTGNSTVMLKAGKELNVSTPAGEVTIHCQEITDTSVKLTAGADQKPLELLLQ